MMRTTYPTSSAPRSPAQSTPATAKTPPDPVGSAWPSRGIAADPRKICIAGAPSLMEQRAARWSRE